MTPIQLSYETYDVGGTYAIKFFVNGIPTLSVPARTGDRQRAEETAIILARAVFDEQIHETAIAMGLVKD